MFVPRWLQYIFSIPQSLNEDDPERWRAYLLDRTLPLLSTFAGLALLLSAQPLWLSGRSDLLLVLGLGYLWLVFISFSSGRTAGRLPYAFRAASLILLLYLLAVAALIDSGFSPSAPALLLAASILAAILLGPRPAITTALAGGLTLAAAGAAFNAGWLHAFTGTLNTEPSLPIWLRASLAFLLLNIVLLLPALTLLQQLEKRLHHERQVRRQLEQQSQRMEGQLRAYHREQQNRTDLNDLLVTLDQVIYFAAAQHDLLRRTVRLVTERFDCSHAAIYLLEDQTGRPNLVLRAFEAPPTQAGQELDPGLPFRPRLLQDGQGLISWVSRYNQAATAPTSLPGGQETPPANLSSPSAELEPPPADLEPPPADVEPQAITDPNAAFPISVGEHVLGVLAIDGLNENDRQSIFSNSTLPEKAQAGKSLDPQAFNALQALADRLALALAVFRRQPAGQMPPSPAADYRHPRAIDTYAFYQAALRLAQITDPDDVLPTVAQALDESAYQTLVLSAKAPGFRLVNRTGDRQNGQHAPKEFLPLAPEELHTLLSSSPTLSIDNIQTAEGLPQGLKDYLQPFQAYSLALLPVEQKGRLSAVFVVVGPPNEADDWLHSTDLRAYRQFAKLTGLTLERTTSLRRMNRRIATLESLDAVSQAISQEIDLKAGLHSLFTLIHEQVQQVIGEVNFLIALYHPETDTISVPYAYDDMRMLQIDPFPIGEGLTSILLHTKEPLMFVENAEEHVRRLGAKTVGRPAKSWMGAPLLVAGQAVGAIIVQDLEHEHRFGPEDLNMLSHLAGQVAVVVNNAHLLEETQQKAEREAQLAAITRQIRSTTDLQAILAMTASQVAEALGARRAHIEINPAAADLEPPPSDY